MTSQTRSRDLSELRKITIKMLGFLFLAAFFSGPPAEAGECAPLLDYSFRLLDESRVIKLCEEYEGQVLLVVNTASKCAYTDQYEDLEALYEHYRDQGFTVLGFPSNDFGYQEPGTERQIRKFCRLTYQVDFPMFEKTRVAPAGASPFYRRLAEEGNGYPAWNFHKFLIDRDGNLAGSFASRVSPQGDQLRTAIEKLL